MIPLLTHTWASSPHTSLPWFLQTDMETTWRWLLTGIVRCAVAKMLPPPDRCTACPTEVGGWWQCPQLAQPSPWCGAGAACSCRARQLLLSFAAGCVHSLHLSYAGLFWSNSPFSLASKLEFIYPQKWRGRFHLHSWNYSPTRPALLTDPTHPALPQQPTCCTQPLLLHGTGRGLDGAPLGRVPSFRCRASFGDARSPWPLSPSASAGPTHSLARPSGSPRAPSLRSSGEAGQGSGAGWAVPQQGALCPLGGRRSAGPGRCRKPPQQLRAEVRLPPPARRLRQGPRLRLSQRPRRWDLPVPPRECLSLFLPGPGRDNGRHSAGKKGGRRRRGIAEKLGQRELGGSPHGARQLPPLCDCHRTCPSVGCLL